MRATSRRGRARSAAGTASRGRSRGRATRRATATGSGVVRAQTRAPTNTSNSSRSSWPRLTSKPRMSSAFSSGTAFLYGRSLRGQRVVDVGDRHHLRLHGISSRAAAARVAGAVELLVVRAGDLRDARASCPTGSATGSCTCARRGSSISSRSSPVSEPRGICSALDLVVVEQATARSPRVVEERASPRSRRCARSRPRRARSARWRAG